ncbi:protein SHORTAGE IN CHIASMATA 1 homolog [Nymphaea colorata]|nr:protein SHORTAGE IN CHIASMATA 1 homolog [Nymphaea colorata]
MRSRFLNVDYFCHPPRDVGIDDLDFLALSIPEPCTSDQLPEGEVCYADLVLTVPSDLDPLCFENALSCFVSAAVPRLYDDQLGAGEFQSDQSETNNFNEQQQDGKYEANEKDEHESVSSARKTIIFKGHLFEEPEISSSTLNPVYVSGSFYQRATRCNSNDAFDSISGAASSYLKELVGQIDLVDAMNLNHVEDKKSFHFCEAAGYERKEKQLFLPKVSLFEACEIGPLVCSHSMAEAFHFLVTDIRLHLLEDNGLEQAHCVYQSSFNVRTLDSLPACALHLRILDLELQPSGIESHTEIISDTCLLLKTLNSSHVPSVHNFVFDEVWVLDIFGMDLIMFYDSSIVPIDNEFSVPLLADLSSIGSFYEAIVAPELAQADDMIKSLPVPLLEDNDIISISKIVEAIFCDMKLCFSSASDQIYLDWHVSQENECSHLGCCLCRNKLDIITSCEMPSTSESLKDDVLINIMLFDNSLSKSVLHQLKEACETIPNPLSRKEGIGMLPDGETIAHKNSEKVSVLLESTTLASDAQKGIATKNYQDGVHNKTVEERIHMVSSSANFSKSCSSSGMIVHEKNFETHVIHLSDVILNIVNKIYGSYISTLGNEKELQSSCTTGDADVHRLRKKKLMKLLTNLTESALACQDEGVMHLIVLYTLKQMAYYVCFLGIHTCYFYMRNFLQRFRSLGNRLACLKSLVEDAYHKAEKDVIEFHPALSVIEEILQACPSQSSKILIVAERAFWWPLTRKLAGLRISFQELRFKSSLSYQVDVVGCINEVLLETDCLIISRDTVLEYGGQYGFSSVTNISQRAIGMHHVHFLKINLEDLDVSTVTSEGFNIFQHLELSMEESYQPLPQMVGLNNQELDNLLNFDPTLEEDYKLANVALTVKVGAGIILQDNPNVPLPRDPDFTDSSSPLFPSIVVITNTQKFSHELLMSRRSSYQKILAMEKDGIQVVEREMHLPVDLIFSSSTCLLWFDAKRVMSSFPEVIPPSMPLCVESIATNLLMSLSFRFSDCILIFEGEAGFLSAVMESSDGLYAAAASLDMHLQLFFSGSSDLTDKIVLSCIKYALKLNKCQCPAMLESETLAESFLASFPSINPLSAHMLLSCEATISEIFEWSCEQRLQAVQKYHVPEDSIFLFSFLCRFGDLGESTSGVTECSSTVSSAFDSDSNYLKMQSPRKKQKYNRDAHLFDIPTNESLHFVQERKCDSTSRLPRKFTSKPDKVCFNSPDSFSFPSSEIQHPDLQLEPGASGTKQMKWNGFYQTEGCHGVIKQEPRDFKLPILKQNFLSSPENRFSTWESEGAGKGTESLTTHGDCSLLFGKSRLAGFASADSDIDSDIWTSFLDSKYSLNKEFCGQNPNEKMEGFYRKDEEDMLQEGIEKWKSRRDSINIQFQEEVTSPGYIDNSYLKSSGLQHGPPWTGEFLKRIKLKMKMHDKFIGGNHSGKTLSKKQSLKRKSPSILDSYRYQGSSSKEKNVSNPKWRKVFKLAHYPSGNKN